MNHLEMELLKTSWTCGAGTDNLPLLAFCLRTRSSSNILKKIEFIVTKTNNWIFNVYFHYTNDEGRERAEHRRQESVVHLRKLLETRSRFSVIAKDENKINTEDLMV